MKFAPTTLVITSFLFPFSALAQVTPDGTTSTTITFTDKKIQIDNGNRAGSNLFHSFDEFSIPTGSEAYFNNANDISNIFTRVTGSNISNIDGLIRANGTANLFLINPNGILFGENASLQLGGSFFGSTADSIVFPDGEFSATDLDNPPLITINAPIGLGFRDNPGDISLSPADGVGLQVSQGETISLIGGNIDFQGGKITAPGADVWLGGLSQAGTIEIKDDGSLSIPEAIARGDVSFSNNAIIDTTGNIGGAGITINARNVSLKEKSTLVTGIAQGINSPNAVAGDILINATDSVNIDAGNLQSQVNEKAKSNTGAINITANDLVLDNKSLLQSQVKEDAVGNTGEIKIKTNNSITLNNESLLLSQVTKSEKEEKQSGIGNAGDINLESSTISFDNKSQAIATTNVQGNAGNITIKADDSVNLSNSSQLSSQVKEGAEGDAGNIKIEANSLNLNQGTIIVDSDGKGNAGSITLEIADKLLLDKKSLIRTGFENNGIGKEGKISINYPQEIILNDSTISSGTRGLGKAGNLNLRTNFLSLDNQSNISSSSNDNVGKENGNFILIEDDIISGEAGIILINSNNVILNNESGINVFTSTNKNGGEIKINANTLEFKQGGNLFAATNSGGNAGNIRLNIKESMVIDGANLPDASTIKPINPPGNPILNEALGETGILANTISGSNGNGGNITIGVFKQEGNNLVLDQNQYTNQIMIKNGASITADSLGAGRGGAIAIRGKNVQLDNGRISATTTSLQEGNNQSLSDINLSVAENLRLSNNARISTEAGDNANAGNIRIDADLIFGDRNNGNGNGNDIIAKAREGAGGDIEINALAVLGIEERKAIDGNGTNDIDASSEVEGSSGTVTINTFDKSLRENIGLPQKVVAPGIAERNTCDISATEETTSGLIIKGKGGITPEPTEPINAETLIVDEENTSNASPQNSQLNPEEIPSYIQPVAYKNNGEPIYLARGVIVQEDGTLILTAYETENSKSRSAQKSYGCN